MSEKKNLNFYINEILNTNKIIYVYIIAVLIFSSVIFFNQYDKPDGLFWDENYHVVSAQKYIDGVYFMECHPPLGKLLIALSERIFNPNSKLDTSGFLRTDHTKSIPKGYRFHGVRFSSTFSAVLSSLVFFLILYNLFTNPHLAFLFTFMFIFDNALVVHLRAAMLDGSQLFFILCAILYFVYIIRIKNSFNLLNYFILGTLTGLAVSVKVNSAVILLLFVFLIFIEYNEEIFKIKFFQVQIFMDIFFKAVVSAAGILMIVFIIFYIHFAIGKRVVDNRFYQASKEYKEILAKGTTANPMNFFIMFRDYKKYMDVFQKGVPHLNPCKSDENGSHPLGWTLGKKAINYRWDKSGNKVRYKYIQCNPVIWFSGLFGILLCYILIGAVYIFKFEIKNEDLFYKILMFTLLYTGYMVAILQIPRVMYLYHYFIPLLFSFVCFYLIFIYIFEELIEQENRTLFFSLFVFFTLIIVVFWWFSPFTYHLPLTYDQFMMRVWSDIWGLKAVN
ncbi:MAG: phospholipid carrier-dependent glycosyltransferase [Spirochaetes bacterium]|nr:phospholipid carrier-dependent glycosyltransferase [Spirochaetota bacterium]